MRLLLIAYYFPPLGGPASIRLGKLVKYLTRSGWDVDVISVGNIIYHSYDHELAEECKTDNIYRTNTIEIISLFYFLNHILSRFRKRFGKRKNLSNHQKMKIYFSFSDSLRRLVKGLFFPDEKIGWLPFACKKGFDLIGEKRYDYIMSSLGPYTAGLIGYKLSKQSGIPLIIDYRDHWTCSPGRQYLTLIHRKAAAVWERKILKKASLVTTVGRIMKSELLERFPEISRDKVITIYNGYDEDDFSEANAINNSLKTSDEKTKQPDEVFFTYTGNLYPPRTPEYFIEAMKHLLRVKALPSGLKVRFFGNYHKDMISLLTSKELADHLSIVPAIPHKEVITEIMKSDLLLLFLPAKEGKGVLTSKVFEYLRSRKPILAMIPDQAEISEILCLEKKHYFCPMEDTKKISELIIEAHNDVLEVRKLTDSSVLKSNISHVEEFSREKQTERFISALKELNGK
jgi:glycosyltransferase involved in cell wall biosynthesis